MTLRFRNAGEIKKPGIFEFQQERGAFGAPCVGADAKRNLIAKIPSRLGFDIDVYIDPGLLGLQQAARCMWVFEL